jgi:hypothetical protein
MLRALDRHRRILRQGVAHNFIRRLWLFLWVPVGALMALVGLETAGVGILLMVPVAILVLNRSPDLFGGAATAFGTGYSTGILFFTVREALLTEGWGVGAFAISQLIVGVVMMAAGLVWAARHRY